MKSDTEVTDAQTAGLLLAVSALMGALRAKNALTADEIDQALSRMLTDVRGSRLAQAVPDDPLIAATLAPIERLQHMNSLFDAETGGFGNWISRVDDSTETSGA